MIQEIYSKIFSTSCAGFEVDKIIRNIKDWIDQKLNKTLPENKKFSNCSSKTTFSGVINS